MLPAGLPPPFSPLSFSTPLGSTNSTRAQGSNLWGGWAGSDSGIFHLQFGLHLHQFASIVPVAMTRAAYTGAAPPPKSTPVITSSPKLYNFLNLISFLFFSFLIHRRGRSASLANGQRPPERQALCAECFSSIVSNCSRTSDSFSLSATTPLDCFKCYYPKVRKIKSSIGLF
jgi:hypothetical protein